MLTIASIHLKKREIYSNFSNKYKKPYNQQKGFSRADQQIESKRYVSAVLIMCHITCNKRSSWPLRPAFKQSPMNTIT